MKNNNENLYKYNSNFESVVILKKNEQMRKHNLIVFPISININKNNHRKNNNYSKKDSSFNSTIVPNYTINSTKNVSIKRDMSNNHYELSRSSKFNTYKENLEQIKIELDNISKIISENNKDLVELNNLLNNLIMNKKKIKKDLENNISDLETLEDKYDNLINEFNNNNTNYIDINENSYIQISFEDLKLNDRNTFIKRIFKTYNELNIYDCQNENFLEFITIITSKAYQNFYLNLNIKKNNINSLMNDFFSSLSSAIFSYKNTFKLSEIIINYILRLLLKINILSENVNKGFYFLENKSEERINDVKKKIDNIKKEIIGLNQKKIKLELIRKNKKENLEIFSIKNSPFCEKTVNMLKASQKEILLNNKISSIMNLYTEYNNKSRSCSIKKNNTSSNIINKTKKNLTKFLTSEYLNINDSTNKKRLQRYSSCNSSKSKKFQPNGIALICSPFENKSKFKSKIKLKLNNDINNAVIPFNNEKEEKNNILLKDYEINSINSFNRGKSTYITKKKKDFRLNAKNSDFIKNGKNIIKSDRNSSKSNQAIPQKKFINENNKKSKDNNLTFAISLKNLKGLGNLKKNPLLKKNVKINKNNNNNNLIKNKSSKDKKNIKKTVSKIDKISYEQFLLNSEMPNKIQIYNSINYSERSNLYNSQKVLSRPKVVESFCFYKLIDNNSILFNPLSNRSNLYSLGYNEGFISINSDKDSLMIKPKSLIIQTSKNLYNNQNKTVYNTINSDEVNNKFINESITNIELNNINNVYLNKTMKNTIKIRKIFMKYNKEIFNVKNNNNDTIIKKAININKILNEKEILNIKDMDQNEKIRAGLCNFFSFILDFGVSKKIEFFLINLFQFNAWYNFLENIVQKNKKMKSKCLIPNGNNSCLVKKNEFCISKINNGKINFKSRQRKNKIMKRSYTEQNRKKFDLKKLVHNPLIDGNIE